MSKRTNKLKLRKDQLRDEFPTNEELAQEIVSYLEGKVSGKAKYIDNYDDVLCIDSMKLMQRSTRCYDDSGWICQCCIVDGKHEFTRMLMERTQDEN